MRWLSPRRHYFHYYSLFFILLLPCRLLMPEDITILRYFRCFICPAVSRTWRRSARHNSNARACWDMCLRCHNGVAYAYEATRGATGSHVQCEDTRTRLQWQREAAPVTIGRRVLAPWQQVVSEDKRAYKALQRVHGRKKRRDVRQCKKNSHGVVYTVAVQCTVCRCCMRRRTHMLWSGLLLGYRATDGGTYERHGAFRWYVLRNCHFFFLSVFIGCFDYLSFLSLAASLSLPLLFYAISLMMMIISLLIISCWCRHWWLRRCCPPFSPDAYAIFCLFWYWCYVFRVSADIHYCRAA